MVVVEVEHIVVGQQAVLTAVGREEDNLVHKTQVLALLVVVAEQQIMEVFQLPHIEILAVTIVAT
jgi:hypothetical protein